MTTSTHVFRDVRTVRVDVTGWDLPITPTSMYPETRSFVPSVATVAIDELTGKIEHVEVEGPRITASGKTHATLGANWRWDALRRLSPTWPPAYEVPPAVATVVGFVLGHIDPDVHPADPTFKEPAPPEVLSPVHPEPLTNWAIFEGTVGDQFDGDTEIQAAYWLVKFDQITEPTLFYAPQMDGGAIGWDEAGPVEFELIDGFLVRWGRAVQAKLVELGDVTPWGIVHLDVPASAEVSR